jgi:hypothetical protein
MNERAYVLPNISFFDATAAISKRVERGEGNLPKVKHARHRAADLGATQHEE